jgi:hypothetical protein
LAGEAHYGYAGHPLIKGGHRGRVFIIGRFRHIVKNEDLYGFSSDRCIFGESWYENLEDAESAASEYFCVKTNEWKSLI